MYAAKARLPTEEPLKRKLKIMLAMTERCQSRQLADNGSVQTGQTAHADPSPQIKVPLVGTCGSELDLGAMEGVLVL